MNEMDDFAYITSLEKRLSESLQPIRPDPGFIHSLKEKLANTSSVIVERRSSHAGLLVIGLGLFTGALLVWLLRRFKA
jgi:hypothetical protein